MVPMPLPGTVVSRPEPESHDGFAEGPSFLSNAPRVPRVVQYHEVLPWADRGAVQQAQRAGDMVAIPARPPMSHPMSNIGDDFIARAIADEAGREAQPSEGPIEPGQDAQSFGN
jgi:penicillin-binding protein 1A